MKLGKSSAAAAVKSLDPKNGTYFAPGTSMAL